MDLSIVTKAGLTKQEFASLMKVSRTTVHNWFGGAGVHVQVSERLEKALAVIARAVEAGDLPLPYGVTRAQRTTKIAEAIRKHARPRQG